jgi:hypothetical protein
MSVAMLVWLTWVAACVTLAAWMASQERARRLAEARRVRAVRRLGWIAVATGAMRRT